MEVGALSQSTLVVAASFRRRVEAFEGLVRNCPGDVFVMLTPQDDAIRRALHRVRFAGVQIHGVERRSDVAEEVALAELARIARLYRGSEVVSPVRTGEIAPAAGPQAPTTIALRTTTFPGPAHKEYLAAHVLAQVPRSIYVPLHVPEFTMRIRFTLEDLGSALIDVRSVRVFRPGEREPAELDPEQTCAVFAIAGHAEIESGQLRALAVNGAVEIDLDVPKLWLRGRCIGVELCVGVEPISSHEMLSTAWLDLASRVFRDPRVPR